MERAIGVKGSRQKPVEDIEAVLGKFSAWSSSQPSEKRPRERVAEISYEQALRAVGFRPQPRKFSVKEESIKTLAETQPALSEPEKRDLTFQPKKPRSRIAKGKRPTPQLERAKTGGVRQRAAHDSRQTAETLCEENPSAVLKSCFAELVKQKVAMMEDVSALKGRSVSLTVRLAPGERALVKARAAEAKISVSAYVRQCALDVDKLREQVEAALAELRSANAGASAVRIANENADWPELTAPENLQKPRPGLITRGLRVLRALWGHRTFERLA